MDIKKQFQDFTHVPDKINNLSALHKLDLGYAHVAKALKHVYKELGFNEEGFFPTFRVKIEGNTLKVLNLTPYTDVVKLMINQPYIQDRYDKNLVKIGSRSNIEFGQVLCPVEIVFDKLSVPVNYQIVTYQLTSLSPLNDKITHYLLNDKAKLLTYELVKQQYILSKLPPIQFDVAGSCITKVYQDLYYNWLNQLTISESKAA